MADVTGDGVADIVIANYLSTGQSQIFAGVSGSVFHAPVSLPNSGGILNFTVQDVNGDGTMEIIAAKSHGGSAYVRQPDGSFQEQVLYSLPSEAVMQSPMVIYNTSATTTTMTVGFYSGGFRMLPISIVPSPDTCPAGRLANTPIYYPNSGQGTRPNVSVTSWDSVWGYRNATDTLHPWPGVSGSSPVLMNFIRGRYLAARFTVPTTAAPTLFGFLNHGTYLAGPPLTMSISQSCGNFNPTATRCYIENRGAGESMVSWVTSENPNRCILTPGQSYYVNVKLTDPNAVNTACNSTSCNVAINSIF